MSRRPPGVTPLLVAAVIVLCLLSGIAIERTVARVLSDLNAPDGTYRALMQDLGGVLFALSVAMVGAAVAAGTLLSRSLQASRAALLARARGDAAVIPRFPLRELDELGSAADRVLDRVSSRERELDREGQDVSLLLDAISEGILQLDAGRRVVRANPAARALLRISDAPGQLIATAIRHVEMRRILESAATGQTIQGTEVAFDDRRIIVSARPVRDPQNPQRGGAVVAFVDLTEVRRLEGVRRDFVANVSHELKTPLTSIRGYVETLLADGDLPEDVRRHFLEVVHKNADRLHRIVDDLLDLSRLESGGWRPELRDVSIADIIDDVWSSCSEKATEQRIAFLPPTVAPRVVADPGALRQVLVNLLDNALRYTPQGGRVEVNVSCSEAPTGVRDVTPETAGEHPSPGNRWVIVEVRDTGIGIPSDALPRIFERFYRVDPARSRAEGGTGLGLSIVKHLVESMGGDVSAESEFGKGTAIRFRLPAAA